MKEENVVEHHPAMEGHFVGHSGNQCQSDVAEESRVPEGCLLECLHGNSRWMLAHFL